MTIAEEIQARLDVVKFSPNWVNHPPQKEKEECSVWRHCGATMAWTMSAAAQTWLTSFTHQHYEVGAVFINDYWTKGVLIEVLEQAVLRAKEEGM